MKKTTISEARAKQIEAENTIKTLLKWDDDKMFWFKVDTCTAYFSSYSPDDVDFLLSQRTVWNWWLNQWAVRDLDFLSHYTQSSSIQWLDARYREINSLELIGVTPQNNLIALAKVIDRVIVKEERTVNNG